MAVQSAETGPAHPRRMTPNDHKARWAARKADDLRRQAAELPYPAGGDWRARKRRQAAMLALQLEAQRFDAIADRLARAA